MKSAIRISFSALLLMCMGISMAWSADPQPLAANIKLPELDRQFANSSGEIELMVAVSESGEVASVNVLSSSDPAINPLFSEAMKSWAFSPATSNGKPMIGLYRHNFQFKNGQHLIGESIWGSLSNAYDGANESNPLVSKIKLPDPSGSLARVSGQVEMMVAISEAGRVLSQYVIHSTNTQLESLCVSAIKKWEFEPKLRDGNAVMGIYRHTFRFDNGLRQLSSRMWKLLSESHNETFGPKPLANRIKFPMLSSAQAQTSGKVDLMVSVGSDGTVAAVSVADSSDRQLNKLCEKAIRSWKFTPAIDFGQPILGLYHHSFIFENGKTMLDEKAWQALTDVQAASSEPEPIADQLEFPILPLTHSSVSGKVDLMLAVDASGKVASIGVSDSSDKVLEEVCVDAVSKWGFRPASNGQKTVMGLYQHTFRFENGQRLFGEKMWKILSQMRQQKAAPSSSVSAPAPATPVAPVAAAAPAPAQKKRGSFRVSPSNRTSPRITAELKNVRGEVEVSFDVDKYGSVVGARAVSFSHKELVDITLAAAKRWKFRVSGSTSGGGIVQTTERFVFEGNKDPVNIIVYPDALSSYNDKGPEAVRRPFPNIPDTLTRRAGKVDLLFIIDAYGYVSHVEVESASNASLGRICSSALYNWKFRPAKQDGDSIATKARCSFSIKQGVVNLDSNSYEKRPALDVQPSIEHSPKPQLASSLSRLKGYVLLEMMIDNRGRVTEARVVESTNDRLDNPSIEASKQWRFTPGIRNGKAVASSMVVPFFYPIGGI